MTEQIQNNNSVKKLFNHLKKSESGLSLEQRIENFSIGGILNIIFTIILTVVSSLIIYNLPEIIGGRSLSVQEAKEVAQASFFIYAIQYFVLIFIWVRLFRNLSNDPQKELSDRLK